MLNVKHTIQYKDTNYMVEETGKVYSGSRELRPYRQNSGYLCLKLVVGGRRESWLVHRLVATLFIPNPHDLPEVNHIDGNKDNNAVANLEWVTRTENKAHAKATGLWTYNEPSTGVKLGKSSRFRNVTYDRSRKKWVGSVRVSGKTYKQKRFGSEVEAARYVNQLLDELGLDNRPRNVFN